MEGIVRDRLVEVLVEKVQEHLDATLDESWGIQALPYADRENEISGLQVNVQVSLPAVEGRGENGRPFEWSYVINLIVPVNSRFKRSFPGRPLAIREQVDLYRGLLMMEDLEPSIEPYETTFLREMDQDYLFGEDFEQYHFPLQLGVSEPEEEPSP